MNNFKLEEKWCIEVTKENSLIVGEYFKIAASTYKDWARNNSVWEEGWIYLNSLNSYNEPVQKSASSTFSSSIPEGQLLTTEQFIKYVLNKEVPATIQSEEYNNILIKLLTK